MTRQKVVIATPCQDQVSAGFALDLAQLVGATALSDPTLELMVLHLRGTYLPQQRGTLAQKALDANASHVLWIDSDMRFPKDALHRLLARKVPIVAANYSTRRAPFLPTAEHRDKGHLFSDDAAAGLTDVSHAGMGLMLVSTDVFRAIEKPWFTLGYCRSDDGWVGEDVYFCRQAKAAGFPTLIDNDLSHVVKHVGEMEYTNAHTVVTRTAWLTQDQRAVHGA